VRRPAAFRVDASVQIGSGHVHRCLALAQAFRSRGVESVFIHREHEGNLRALIESRGFRVYALPTPLPDYRGPADADYGSWLGVPESIDAEESSEVLRAVGAQLVIVDHYGLGRGWEGFIRPHVEQVVVIEDLPDRPHSSDVIIDQVGTRTHRANRLGPPHGPEMTLAGPHYALIDATFSWARRLATRRSDVGRILVFFGASDRQGLTEHALRVLSEPLFSRIHLDVVIGINASRGSNVERLAQSRGRTVLHESQRTLAPLMLRADLMIGAAGMTSWERCTLGLPSIAAIVAENQQRGAALLVAEGAARSMDLRTPDEAVPADFEQRLRNELRELLAEPTCLPAMSDSAFRLTDGCGAARVAEVLLPTSPDTTRLRPVTYEDRALLFRWANDTGVRRASFRPEPISWDEHIAWFAAVQSDPSSRIWILEAQDSLPVGQFRVSVENGVGVVDYSVDSDFRGRGLGRRILSVGLDAWRQDFPTVPLRAETTLENRRSRAALAAAGWTEGDGGRWSAGGRGTNLDLDGL